jgi:hypothetical protein
MLLKFCKTRVSGLVLSCNPATLQPPHQVEVAELSQVAGYGVAGCHFVHRWKKKKNLGFSI